jgi:hypothetical protein
MGSEGSWTSLSSCGIQYRILVVLNAQGPLFIGWGAEWATTVICTDAVRTVNQGRPDGQLYNRIIQKFCWKSFLFKTCIRTVRQWRPNGLRSTASNFLIRLRASGPRGKNVRMAILQHAISISTMRASRPWEADVRTVEVESTISILVACTSGPRLTDVWTMIFELQFLPYLRSLPDGKPHLPDGVSIFPYTELGKNLKLIDHWWTSGRAAERSGRMQAGTEASRHSVGSKRKRYVIRTDDAGLSGVRSGWIHRPNGWNSGQMGVRMGWHVVRTAHRESEIFYLFCCAESSENTLTSGIPIYSIFTHKWFCPNTKWGQNTNKLPLWPFWDKNHLTSLEIHSGSKNKNYSPFLSQRDKV